MALSFPLSLNQFFKDLGIVSATFDIMDTRSGMMTGGGDVMSASTGPALWHGSISVKPMHWKNRIGLETKANLLKTAGASFKLWHPEQRWPAAYDDSSVLDGSAITIASVSTDNRELTMSGVPVGYQFTSGDAIGFTYGSNPTRYAYHRVLENSATATVEVQPPIRAGFAVGISVDLVQPVLVAKIVPNSIRPFTIGTSYGEGFSFDWSQTLR